MNRHLTRLLAALFFALISLPALAQWQVPNHSLPLGKGPGVVGFGSIAAAANTKFLVGGGTSSDPVMATMSGDCGLVAGVVTCTKANGVTMPSSGTSGGIPYYSSSSAISSSAALAANQIVLGGGAGTTPATLGSLGTTTTLLHGNAAGAPTFGAAVSADLNITTTSCTNQFVTAISAGAVGTCTTDTLAGAQHANQGTTTTVLHGNASGNPSFAAVAIGSDVSGLGTGMATFLATPSSANARAALTDESGTGAALFQSGDLGTPTAGVATNLTGTAAGLTAGNVTTNANLTGVITSSGNATSIASQTGTGTKFVVDTGPTLTGAVTVAQSIFLTGDISPAQIVANTNDYAPTGFSTATTLRLNTDASRNITGLAGGASGRFIVIHNVGSFNIVLTNQDAASTAANRFLFGGDMTLIPDSSVTIKYDTTSSRWRAITTPGAGGGGGGVTGVTIAAGSGIGVSGTCAITTSGTCTVALSTPVSIANGGTNATSASAAVTSLGTASAQQTGGPVNAACAASVSGNALTVALKGNDGNDPSASNPVYVPFRSATATTGTQDVLTVTSATSFVISSGSTMGFTSGALGRLWVVGINDAGTFRVGAVNALSGTSIMSLRDNVLSSSTAEGGAGAADNAQTIYTGTAVTSKGMRILCYVEATEATAGTWATTPSLIQMFGPGIPKPGETVQVAVSQDSASASGSTTIPSDNTIPQNTEGNQYMSQAITPTSAANVLLVEHQGTYTSSALNSMSVALFQDSTANSLAASTTLVSASNSVVLPLRYRMRAATTSSTTFKIRAGAGGAGTTFFNGYLGAQVFGGVSNSYLSATEIMG